MAYIPGSAPVNLKFVSFWTWWRLFLLLGVIILGGLVALGLYPLWLYLVDVPLAIFLGAVIVPHED